MGPSDNITVMNIDHKGINKAFHGRPLNVVLKRWLLLLIHATKVTLWVYSMVTITYFLSNALFPATQNQKLITRMVPLDQKL